MKKFSFSIFIFLFFTISVFSQIEISKEKQISQNTENLTFLQENIRAEKSISLDEKSTRITIKTNVQNAEIYLNGQFEGNSPLTLNNIAEGRYFLKVQKNGYKTKHYRISIKKGVEESYYVELEQNTGFASFTVFPQNAEIFVDDQKVSFNEELIEGNHTLSVKCFGYKTEKSDFFIFKDRIHFIKVTLSEAEPEISNFDTNKTSFNPSLNGKIGQIKFSFYVTKDFPVQINIFDQNENIVFSKKMQDFSTWMQTFYWNGKSINQNKVKNGSYKAVISGDGKESVVKFEVDDSIKLPFSTLTHSGSGNECVPSAFSFPSKTTVLTFSSALQANSTTKSFYNVPLSAGFSSQLNDYFEFSSKADIFIFSDKLSPQFSANLKSTLKKEFSSFNLGFAPSIKCGISSLRKNYSPFSSNGISLGFTFGIDSQFISANYFTEGVLFPSTYENFEEKLLKNGASIQFKKSIFSVAAFSCLHSVFNSLNKETSKLENRPLKANESGIELIFAPVNKNFLINFCTSVLFLDKNVYFNIKGGINFLF